MYYGMYMIYIYIYKYLCIAFASIYIHLLQNNTVYYYYYCYFFRVCLQGTGSSCASVSNSNRFPRLIWSKALKKPKETPKRAAAKRGKGRTAKRGGA